ncbi:SEC-C metal-binding domain-containing protein [Fibrobacter sp.]|uniref:YecA family protein n=1 Tax=Fibrobacter sp. TaxID=35828 RepID=UPI002628E9C9|nr:SEC-C metal-binding domain-containing protein [Fibrobacter sp.]MDD5942855.1 SEC-C metal-binding domain-containing protein [Fibrobacter sp.]
MNINSLPKDYRSRLLRETNCIHKEPIPSKTLAKLLNACPKDPVQDIHFCTTPELEKDEVCEEQLRKAEYIEILKNRIPKIFESFVKYSGDFEFSLFLDLMFGKYAGESPFKEMFPEGYPARFNFPNIDERVFKFVEQNLSIGFMFLFGTNEDNLTLVVPEEFLEIARGTKRNMAGFHDYCKVYANLYGVCNPETVISKWNMDHVDRTLTKKQGVAAINECSLFTRYFTSYGVCLCAWSVETTVVIEHIIEERKIHRPYKPTNEEFNEWLDYTDDINENLAEFKTIRDHFKKYSDTPAFADFDAHCLLDDLRMAMEHPAAIIERYRLQIGFTRIDMDKITPIISAIMELNNKARLWVTYGNVPDELSSSQESGFGMKQNIAVVRSTPKVGRNDPCPCGSGLKYKKCCGKMVN